MKSLSCIIKRKLHPFNLVLQFILCYNLWRFDEYVIWLLVGFSRVAPGVCARIQTCSLPWAVRQRNDGWMDILGKWTSSLSRKKIFFKENNKWKMYKLKKNLVYCVMFAWANSEVISFSSLGHKLKWEHQVFRVASRWSISRSKGDKYLGNGWSFLLKKYLVLRIRCMSMSQLQLLTPSIRSALRVNSDFGVVRLFSRFRFL